MAMISLVEYARRHGKARTTVYKKYAKGGFVTAQKVGRDIVIDEDEPYVDNRIKTGSYIGFREGYQEWKRAQNEIAVQGNDDKK